MLIFTLLFRLLNDLWLYYQHIKGYALYDKIDTTSLLTNSLLNSLENETFLHVAIFSKCCLALYLPVNSTQKLSRMMRQIYNIKHHHFFFKIPLLIPLFPIHSDKHVTPIVCIYHSFCDKKLKFSFSSKDEKNYFYNNNLFHSFVNSFLNLLGCDT